ncbi:hypothetical protein DJ564_16905 [Pseudomonas sp. 31-12]|nr:hypothetical protein DJ564_16905 [Pseudomonas sp. 31-12]
MARGLAPVGVRSAARYFDSYLNFGAAAQPNGGKPPRHRSPSIPMKCLGLSICSIARHFYIEEVL